MLRREIGNVLTENIPKIFETEAKTKKKLEDQFSHLLGYFDDSTLGFIDQEDALNGAQQKFFRIQKENCSARPERRNLREIATTSS